MQSTMMRLPLSLNHLLERAGALFPESQIVSRLPDKSLRCHSYAEFYRRAGERRAVAAADHRLDDEAAGIVENDAGAGFADRAGRAEQDEAFRRAVARD